MRDPITLWRPAISAWLGACMLAAASPAQAAQPLATDDADVKTSGECELESGVSRTRDQGGPAVTAWTTQVGCGVGMDLELGLGGGSTQGGGQHSTLWSFGGKKSLRKRSDDEPGYALAWSVLADQSPGVPPKAHGWLLALIASGQWRPDWLVHGNLGINHDRPSHRTRLSWALATEHALNDAFDLTAEMFGVGADQPSASLGLRWNAGRHLVMGLACAHQFSGPRSDTQVVTVTLSF